jgi:hypothetical protein
MATYTQPMDVIGGAPMSGACRVPEGRSTAKVAPAPMTTTSSAPPASSGSGIPAIASYTELLASGKLQTSAAPGSSTTGTPAMTMTTPNASITLSHATPMLPLDQPITATASFTNGSSVQRSTTNTTLSKCVLFHPQGHPDCRIPEDVIRAHVARGTVTRTDHVTGLVEKAPLDASKVWLLQTRVKAYNPTDIPYSGTLMMDDGIPAEGGELLYTPEGEARVVHFSLNPGEHLNSKALFTNTKALIHATMAPDVTYTKKELDEFESPGIVAGSFFIKKESPAFGVLKTASSADSQAYLRTAEAAGYADSRFIELELYGKIKDTLATNGKASSETYNDLTKMHVLMFRSDLKAPGEPTGAMEATESGALKLHTATHAVVSMDHMFAF